MPKRALQVTIREADRLENRHFCCIFGARFPKRPITFSFGCGSPVFFSFFLFFYHPTTLSRWHGTRGGGQVRHFSFTFPNFFKFPFLYSPTSLEIGRRKSTSVIKRTAQPSSLLSFFNRVSLFFGDENDSKKKRERENKLESSRNERQ